MALPAGLNATSLPAVPGNVAGLVYLVPKPVADQGYAEMNGEVACAIAIALPAGLKARSLPVPVGSVAGSANLVPKPVLLLQA